MTLHIKKELTKIGKQLPYFSITAEVWEGFTMTGFGCMHDEILAAHPEYADLVALHLSDINGVPMHAIENGWYWLVSSVPGAMGEKWFSESELSLDHFCNHCRISTGDGLTIAMLVNNVYTFTKSREAAKATWVAICESMKPRWKKEADAAIVKYQLKVENT